MPSIDLPFLEQLRDDYRNYPCFIETGTHCGDTVLAVEPYFRQLYTVEISETYFALARDRATAAGSTNIRFLLGDSTVVFRHMLPSITEKTIFFLDGHWSSGDTGRGDKDVPLLEEIALIHDLFVHDAILIIDDFRLFGKGPDAGVNEDWTDIGRERILELLGTRVKDMYHLGSEHHAEDRFIVHIEGRSSTT